MARCGFRQTGRDNGAGNRSALIIKLSHPASAYQKRILKMCGRRSCVESTRRLRADSAPAGCRIEVFRNGVDLNLFRETERDRTRRELNLTGPVIISVGHLIPRKGHELVIEALSLLPRAQLLICGEGPMRSELERSAQRFRVRDRVRFLGLIRHEELNRYYSAADVLVLASFREGWPNVVLEAMACGTPVVATAVGAVPDFVDHPHAGRVVRERTVARD